MDAEPNDVLGPLSLAEWEYAYRYRDYLETGDVRPDRTGWDLLRVREIERRIYKAVKDRQNHVYADMGKRLAPNPPDPRP